MIKNTLPNKSENPESLKKYSQQFESFSSNVSIIGGDLLRAFYVLFYLRFCGSSDQSKKHCVAKILLAIWGIFLHENNCNYNSYRFNYKFAFIFFLSFLTNQKQKSGFQQVSGLVTINISVFLFIVSRNPGGRGWVSLALLQNHAEFNKLL